VDPVQRELEINQWAKVTLDDLGIQADADFSLEPASDDASFRRYFRGLSGAGSFIFVDAPPEFENSRPFIQIAGLLQRAGVLVPEVYRVDLDRGFMMLSDFGNTLFLAALAETRGASQMDKLYADAFTSLLKVQAVHAEGDVPDYDEDLLRAEMNLFPEWFLTGLLGTQLSASDQENLQTVFSVLVDNALQQPRVFVHRDFHSRNLMILPDRSEPGVIDFQDAVTGPVTYDLVSLLRDCYHRLSPARIDRMVDEFRQRLIDIGRIKQVDQVTFRRWFDLMGLQRHIKCAGIFSRLNLRDGKPRYLRDIPLVLDYMLEVSRRYDELHSFAAWLEKEVKTRFMQTFEDHLN
jgi:aminoglycoside/choline kinase family phosphotransferase